VKRLVKYILIMLFALFAVLPSTAFADEDYNDGASFDWSPYDWQAIPKISWLPDSNDICGVFSNVKFDEDTAGAHNSILYLTFEINNISDNLPHSGWYVSSLPDVGFDVEDDDEDGFEEEVEAYISGALVPFSKASIDADSPYSFETCWRNSSSTSMSGDFDYIVQRSFYAGEMQAIHFDKLDSTVWSVPGASLLNNVAVLSDSTNNAIKPKERRFTNILQDSTLRISQEEGTEKYNVFHDIQSIEAFEAYENKQINMAYAIKKSSAEAVITFDQPLEEADLEELIKLYEFKVSSFEIKAFDQNGRWITIQGEPSEEELIPKVMLEKYLSENELSYVGVTSVQADIQQFHVKKLQTLQSDDRVFLTDITKAYVKQITGNDQADVRVPDLAWQIEKLKSR
jgi:hypothetical protein